MAGLTKLKALSARELTILANKIACGRMSNDEKTMTNLALLLLMTVIVIIVTGSAFWSMVELFRDRYNRRRFDPKKPTIATGIIYVLRAVWPWLTSPSKLAHPFLACPADFRHSARTTAGFILGMEVTSLLIIAIYGLLSVQKRYAFAVSFVLVAFTVAASFGSHVQYKALAITLP